MPTSQGFESNAAKQDANESFCTAKEEEQDVSGALKKDTSMELNTQDAQKGQYKKSRSYVDLQAVAHGRARSDNEQDDHAGPATKPRLQDMLDEDLLHESNDDDASDANHEVNPYIQQRSQSMFLQSDSNVDDLIDYHTANFQAKKTGKRKNSGAGKKKKNQFGEAKNLASKVQNRINEEKRKNVFPETSKEQEERIRRNSPYGSLLTWKLFRVIVKSNDDVRQEQFAIQLISQFDQIFKKKKLDLWLKPYEILATGQRCGLIEVCNDTLSISSIKEKLGGKNVRIVDYFRNQFGSTRSRAYKTAR